MARRRWAEPEAIDRGSSWRVTWIAVNRLWRTATVPRRRGNRLTRQVTCGLMADVSMPRLSDSMEEGTILKWLKSDGDEVKRGDELVEIETDKANMTYEADQDGVLSISASEGDTLAVGERIATIGEGAEAPDEP